MPVTSVYATPPQGTTPDLGPVTGPEILRQGAVLLPTVVDRGQATATAVHVAVYRAALQLRGCHAGAAHQLAGEAVEMLVAYLAGVHHLRDAARDVQHEAMRTWAFGRAAATVSWAMRAAAEYWRAELSPAALAAAAVGADGYVLVLTEEGYTTADGPMPRGQALAEFRRISAGIGPHSPSRLRVMTEAEYLRLRAAAPDRAAWAELAAAGR